MLIILFMYWRDVSPFPLFRKTTGPYNIVKNYFNGTVKEFPHNSIILTEISSGPWALIPFRTERILIISSFENSNVSSFSAVARGSKFTGSSLEF